MIVSTGLGDDSIDVSSDSGVGVNFNGAYLTFALIGLFAVVSVFRRGSSSHLVRSQRVKRTGSKARGTSRRVEAKITDEYKLEVDITGNGRWVEQAQGSKRELGKVATQIKNQEGMKTRLVAL